MKPVFKDLLGWQQAELLMQPAFIRIIDNIRKQMDESTWKGTYRDVPIWPEGTPEEMKATVTELRQRLTTVSSEQAQEIEELLSRLPSPHPGYHLCLQKGEQEVSIDLWQLCYQTCFRNYIPSLDEPGSQEVEIDTTLIDETGDVDWQNLDTKVREIVERIFSNLPGS